MNKQSAGSAFPGNSSIMGEIVSDLMSDFGLSYEQAAGVAGNLAHETGGFRHSQEISPVVRGSLGGFGWAQWTGPRREAFMEYARENKLPATSYAANYGFLKDELSKNYTPTLDALKGKFNIKDATKSFENTYEKAGVKNYPSRNAYAQDAFFEAPLQRTIDDEPVIAGYFGSTIDDQPVSRFGPPIPTQSPLNAPPQAGAFHPPSFAGQVPVSEEALVADALAAQQPPAFSGAMGFPDPQMDQFTMAPTFTESQLPGIDPDHYPEPIGPSMPPSSNATIAPTLPGPAQINPHSNFDAAGKFAAPAPAEAYTGLFGGLPGDVYSPQPEQVAIAPGPGMPGFAAPQIAGPVGASASTNAPPAVQPPPAPAPQPPAPQMPPGTVTNYGPKGEVTYGNPPDRGGGLFGALGEAFASRGGGLFGGFAGQDNAMFGPEGIFGNPAAGFFGQGGFAGNQNSGFGGLADAFGGLGGFFGGFNPAENDENQWGGYGGGYDPTPV